MISETEIFFLNLQMQQQLILVALGLTFIATLLIIVWMMCEKKNPVWRIR